MKKILVDIYLSLNLGDDMFLDVLAKRYPDAEITVFHPGSNYNFFLKIYNNVKSISYGLRDKLLRKLSIYNRLTDYGRLAKEFDILLFLGGGIFREEVYENEVFQNRKSIIEAFIDKNKEVFFLGCNFGPFNSEYFLKKHKELFNKCSDVCFRDRYSYNLFKDLPNIRYAPDILWSYNIDDVRPKENVIGYSIINPKHKDGLEKYYEDYVDIHTKSILKNIKKQYVIMLFSFCEKEGDLATIKDILNNIDSKYHEQIIIHNYEGNIDAYLSELSKVKVLYAARFHANIIGFLQKTSVIPIIYSNKTSNLLDDIDFKDTIVTFDSLDKLLSLDIDQLENNYSLPQTKGLSHFTELDKILQ